VTTIAQSYACPGGDGPAAFGARVTREIAQWRELIQSVKINVE